MNRALLLLLDLLQTLLQNNASASFFNSRLSGTEWRVSDISDFLSKASEDRRPAGSAFTWRDVFNETDQAVQTISRFMEVSRSTFSHQSSICITPHHVTLTVELIGRPPAQSDRKSSCPAAPTHLGADWILA